MIAWVYGFAGITSDTNIEVADIVIFLCNLTILFIHHLYCYYGKCFNRNSWNCFFQNMAILDEFSTDRNLTLVLLKIICMLAIFFGPSCAIIFFYGFDGHGNWMNTLANAFWILAILQLFYLVVFWCETCNILSLRYKFIINTVKGICSEDIYVRQKSMKEIINIIVGVHKTVKYINEAAGFFILDMLVMSTLASLTCVNLILLQHPDNGFFKIIWYFPYSISFMVLSIIVIMSCDQVEKKSTEFIQTCIYIQATTGDEQAATLANLANQLRPKFSAAGFFDINQRLLPVFFSNLSTYLIIILQFKISSL
uniref:Gustatory receptor n=1 Tax=Diabrotica virgifera virgifera TaxID=50390 RepID=A0A6P7GSY5_DIAVI